MLQSYSHSSVASQAIHSLKVDPDFMLKLVVENSQTKLAFEWRVRWIVDVQNAESNVL